MMKIAFTCACIAFLLASCMTGKEYMLRRADIEAKKAHPTTYSPLAIKGPLNVPDGGELVITVPNMPYQQTSIPDGQAYQLKALGITATTAAAVAGGYFIKSAGGDSNHTTINNNAAAPVAP